MLFGPKYIVIDLANLIARVAFVKTQHLTTANGTPSGHVYRAYRSILKLKRDHGAQLVFAFEGSHLAQRRYKIYPNYKQPRRERDALANELEVEAFDPRPDITRMIKMMRCKLIYHPEAEADDAVATWVATHVDDACIVVSWDQDLWYLLRHPKVTIIGRKNEQILASTVSDTFGCMPANVPLLKALYGDISDYIPGVPRLRWKDVKPFFATNTKLTPNEFFQWVEANCGEATKDKIVAHKEQIELMYQVAHLQEDLALETSDLPGDKPGLRTFLDSFECSSVLDTVQELT